MATLLLALFVGVAVGVGVTVAVAGPASMDRPAPVPASTIPAEYHRSIEQTFLTYPEWFLVHSPAEYAVFIKDHRPSDFPYFGHIGQFWTGYAAVSRAIRERRYPANPGYHVMILVIGLSTTAEYAVKGTYERLVGRFTEILRSTRPTPEDVFAARMAQDYVDFIRIRPWYEFDFVARLRGLWTRTGLVGHDPLRKWERKLALTNEYAAKAAYGWLIMKATHAAYEQESTVTAVVLDGLASDLEARMPEVRVIERRADGSILATLPRYGPFTDVATALARAGVGFRDIAGNRADILVSALVPPEFSGAPEARLLFTQPILTQPSQKRVLLIVPVERLAPVLARLSEPPARIEHVYDY